MIAVDVQGALRVAEAYCYEAGAANAANNVKQARAAVAELIAAVDYALNTRDDAGALNSTAEHNLYAALAGVAANAACKGGGE